MREGKDRVRIFDGHRVAAEHERLEDGKYARSTLAQHRRRGLWRSKRDRHLPPLEEEQVLQAAGGSLARLALELRKRHGGRAAGYLRRLHRMYLDYPSEVLERSVSEAFEYGLRDLRRIERMVLRNVAGEFFRLHDDEEG